MFLLVGAGGNGRIVANMAGRVTHYVDPHPSKYIVAEHIASDDIALKHAGTLRLAMGMAGVNPDQLERRYSIARKYVEAGFDAPALIHPTASVAHTVMQGSIVMDRCVVQAGSYIAPFVLMNAGAIVTHDCHIGAGTHIGPGAIICGDVTIGECCMIGAGAVVLPGAKIPDGTLVKALTRHPR